MNLWNGRGGAPPTSDVSANSSALLLRLVLARFGKITLLPLCLQCDIGTPNKSSDGHFISEGTRPRRDWWLPFQVLKTTSHKGRRGFPALSHSIEN